VALGPAEAELAGVIAHEGDALPWEGGAGAEMARFHTGRGYDMLVEIKPNTVILRGKSYRMLNQKRGWVVLVVFVLLSLPEKKRRVALATLNLIGPADFFLPQHQTTHTLFIFFPFLTRSPASTSITMASTIAVGLGVATAAFLVSEASLCTVFRRS
jgi:hypothetical protein